MRVRGGASGRFRPEPRLTTCPPLTPARKGLFLRRDFVRSPLRGEGEPCIAVFRSFGYSHKPFSFRVFRVFRGSNAFFKPTAGRRQCRTGSAGVGAARGKRTADRPKCRADIGAGRASTGVVVANISRASGNSGTGAGGSSTGGAGGRYFGRDGTRPCQTGRDGFHAVRDHPLSSRSGRPIQPERAHLSFLQAAFHEPPHPSPRPSPR